MKLSDLETCRHDVLELNPEWSDSSHSRVFKMSAGRFAIELLFRYAWIWLLSLSLFAVAGIVLGVTVGLLWLVAALLIICIVLPMVLGFLYYFYGLRKECFVNTVPHRLILCEDGIACRLWIKETKEDSRQHMDDVSDKSEIRFRDEVFPFSKMARFIIGKDSAIVPLKKPASGFLWIPADSFADAGHLTLLLQKLDEKTEYA